MDINVILRFFMALVFTLSLIGLLYWLVRRYVPSKMLMRAGAGNRLQVAETRTLDARRSLVLVKRDNVEHLILLGPQGDLLIEAGIKPVSPIGDGSFRDQVVDRQNAQTTPVGGKT